MSSVFADDPRSGAKSNLIAARLDRRVRSGGGLRAASKARGAAGAETRSASEPGELQLVGEASTKAAAPRRDGWLAQLGWLPLLLYIATAAVVVFTGAWVVSDISRRHRPVDRPAVADASFDAMPAIRSDGPPLQPPARLGEGVVVSSAPAAGSAPDSHDALNALMLRAAEEPSAQVESAASGETPAVVAPAEAPALTQDVATPAPEAPAAAMASAEPPAATADVNASAPATAAMSKCLLKVDGKVLFQRACSGEQSASRATFTLGDKLLVVSLSRGEIWQATFGSKSLGAVYRTGQCWGRKKQVYICAE